MTWLIISALCLFTGGCRFLEGSSDEKIPSGLLKAAMFLSIGSVAYIVSSSWVVSVGVGLISVATISAGYTEWDNLKHQIIRGAIPCLLMIGLLCAWEWQLPTLSHLGMLGLHITAFAFYWLEGKVKPPFCELEQFARWVQGVCICGAAGLV